MKLIGKYISLLLIAKTSVAQVNTSNNTAYGVQSGVTIQNAGGSGTNNAFFGAYAGQLVSSGNQNTLIGIQTGKNVSTGAANTFLGYGAGQNTTKGNFNTFIGTNSGSSNTEGSSNFFLGTNAGLSNSVGSANVFIGDNSGGGNTYGARNVFVGLNTGGNNASGNDITLIGYGANVTNSSLNNATAIGKDAQVSISNALVLGNNDVNVGIGVSAPRYRLAVNGTVAAREVNVTAEAWADFVFEENYLLPKLTSVEQYVKIYKHLPEIPSADEVAKNGIQLGNMNSKLLQKVEELTLYMIDQQKEIDQLKRQISQLINK